MSRFHRIGLIGIVIFGVLWSFFLVLRYVAGELRIEDLGSMVFTFVLLLLALHSYRIWIRERSRRVEREFLETPAIYGWHPIILFLLTLIIAPMTYTLFHSGLDKITVTMWIPYGTFVFLLLLVVAVMATSRISIDAGGLWTSRGYFSWDDFERARLKWNGRLLILGREGVYILPKLSEFARAVETFKPKPAKNSSVICGEKALF